MTDVASMQPQQPFSWQKVSAIVAGLGFIVLLLGKLVTLAQWQKEIDLKMERQIEDTRDLKQAAREMSHKLDKLLLRPSP
jgi:biopolymer transport protein ExbB/TolQ